MATLNLTTTEDTHAASGANDAGKRPALGLVSSAAVLAPGSHGGGDEYSAAARFTGVTIPQGATINSATLSLRANATYNAGASVIAYIVCCQAADNAGALATSGSTDLDGATRPGTTADTQPWVQTSVTGGTRYTVDITSAVQEVINRAGWASGNAIVVLIDTHSTCTVGEWQEYDANSATLGPQLSIDYATGGGSDPEVTPPAENPRRRAALSLTTFASNLLLTTLAVTSLPFVQEHLADPPRARRTPVPVAQAASANLTTLATGVVSLPPGAATFPTRLDRRVGHDVDIDTTPGDDAVVPFAQADWPAARQRAAQQPQPWPALLETTLAPVIGAPIGRSAFPERMARRRGVGISTESRPQEDGAVAFTETEWPNPGTKRRPAVGFTVGPIASSSAVVALPPGGALFPARLERRSAHDVDIATTPGDDAVQPFNQNEWRRPISAPRPAVGVAANRPSFFTEPVSTPPFVPEDFPNPARRRLAGLLFLDGISIDDTDPIRPSGLALPPRRRPAPVVEPVENLLQATLATPPATLPVGEAIYPSTLPRRRALALSTDSRPQEDAVTPTVPGDWPVTRRPKVVGLSFTQARPSFYAEPVVTLPFAQDEWPTPRAVVRQSVRGFIGYFGLDDTEPLPNGRIETPDQILAARRPNAGAALAGLNMSTLAPPAGPQPFALEDWPTSTRTREQLRDRSFTQARPAHYIEPTFVLPFSLDDWPTASRTADNLTVSAPSLLLTTLATVDTPAPFSQNEWSTARPTAKPAQTWVSAGASLTETPIGATVSLTPARQARALVASAGTPLPLVDATLVAPFSQEDWPLARGIRARTTGQQNSRPSFFVEPTPRQPAQFDWPIPRRKTVMALSHLQGRPTYYIEPTIPAAIDGLDWSDTDPHLDWSYARIALSWRYNRNG